MRTGMVAFPSSLVKNSLWLETNAFAPVRYGIVEDALRRPMRLPALRGAGGRPGVLGDSV